MAQSKLGNNPEHTLRHLKFITLDEYKNGVSIQIRWAHSIKFKSILLLTTSIYTLFPISEDWFEIKLSSSLQWRRNLDSTHS
jgi:hypothetical protein